jgi:hypothetical protein
MLPIVNAGICTVGSNFMSDITTAENTVILVLVLTITIHENEPMQNF